jgi:hypothetical protein
MSDRRWIPIRYRDFWDVPRIFLAQDGAQSYLFDCNFDEATGDYPDTYKVYTIPTITDESLPKDWDLLLPMVTAYLGEIPLQRVQFDASRRRFIDPTILDELRAGKPVAQ